MNENILKLQELIEEYEALCNEADEMEDVGEEGWAGDNYNGEPCWNEKLIPLITNNSIKIIKIL